MKLDLLYDRDGYYIGFDKVKSTLYAWTSMFDPYKEELKPVILCEFNSITKKVAFSVLLADEDMDMFFISALNSYLYRYGFSYKKGK